MKSDYPMKELAQKHLFVGSETEQFAPVQIQAFVELPPKEVFGRSRRRFSASGKTGQVVVSKLPVRLA